MTTRVKARLFGGGVPATGAATELAIVDQAIEVHAGDDVLRAPIAALSVREIGIDLSGLEFAWSSAKGSHAVQVLDAESLSALRRDATLASAPQLLALRAKQRRTKVGRTLGWVSISFFLLLPVLVLLVFFWQADRIALAAAARIPIAEEVKLGEQAFANMSGSLALVDRGPAYDAVENLGKRLSVGSKYTYRFHVANNEAVNAFALPGGIVVVHSGLINATRRPEELAGVLAHEIQHVEQRHSLQAVVKDLGLRGLWMLVTGDIGGGVLGRAALEVTSLTFSREAEAQADAKGFDTLVARGIDPSGMADFFQVLAKQDGTAPPPFLSTHPASAEREKLLRARVNALGQRHFQPLEVTPWPPTANADAQRSR